MKEQIEPRGIFTLRVFRNGKLVEEFAEKNLVVVGGRTAIARLIGGEVDGNSVTQIGFGEGTSPANILNTSLTNVYKKDVINATFPIAGQVDINWSLEEDEGNGKNITEFGLFTESNALFARKVREVIQKTADIRLEGKWQLIF